LADLEEAPDFGWGADSLCIKDMAGLIAPDHAHDLLKALNEVVRIPVDLHTHYTSGMASMACLRAIEAGVDIVELGVPFSDPLADGPVIQASSYRALQKGVTLHKILKRCQKNSDKIANSFGADDLLQSGFSEARFSIGMA
jgi:pyruvate/oxaloacetate carboxyltransferase